MDDNHTEMVMLYTLTGLWQAQQLGWIGGFSGEPTELGDEALKSWLEHNIISDEEGIGMVAAMIRYGMLADNPPDDYWLLIKRSYLYSAG